MKNLETLSAHSSFTTWIHSFSLFPATARNKKLKARIVMEGEMHFCLLHYGTNVFTFFFYFYYHKQSFRLPG